MNEGIGNAIHVYFKTGVVKEFDGKTKFIFNGVDTEKYDFDGSWWDNGVGVSVQVKDKHHFYAEADYAKGSRFDKKQLNIGYRFTY